MHLQRVTIPFPGILAIGVFTFAAVGTSKLTALIARLSRQHSKDISPDNIPVRCFGLCKLPPRPHLQYVEILTSCIRLAAVACAAVLPPDMPVVAVVLGVVSTPDMSKNFFHRAITVSSVLVAFRAASCTLAPGIHLRVARKNARRFRPFISV